MDTLFAIVILVLLFLAARWLVDLLFGLGFLGFLASFTRRGRAPAEPGQAGTSPPARHGHIEGVGIADDDKTLVQVDVRRPSQVLTAEDGRRYLFSAGPVEFVHEGVTYRTSAFSARELRKG